MLRSAFLIWFVGGLGAICVDAFDHIGENPSRNMHPIVFGVACIILFGCYIALYHRLDN